MKIVTQSNIKKGEGTTPAKIKPLALVYLLIFLIFMLLNCASTKPILPQYVFSSPGIDFSKFKRIAIILDPIFLDLEYLSEEEMYENINNFFEQELEKRGYDILSSSDLISFLENGGFSIKDLSNPEILHMIKNNLNISAIIKAAVKIYEYEPKTKRVEHFHRVTPTSDSPKIYSTEDALVFMFDISLVLEMIEAQQGNNVWTCSISCDKKKVEGYPYKLIRKIIKNCVITIPKKQ